MTFQHERRRDDARTMEDNWADINEFTQKKVVDNIENFIEEKALKLAEVADFIEISTFSQHRVLPFVDNGKFGLILNNIKRLPKAILDKYNEVIYADQFVIDSFMSAHWNTYRLKVSDFKPSPNITAVSLAKFMLQKMIDAKAADLTMHSVMDSVEVSYSVAGKNVTELKDIIEPEMAEKIRVSIINMAGENQAEKIVDGGFGTRLSGQIKEFRLNYAETALGFAMVLRSYESFNLNQTLADLGYMEKPLSIIQNIMNDNSYGIFLITGPTGSGKTTTIYTLINQEYKEKDLKIKTAEDPVEVIVPGIDQCSINKKGDERHLITYQRLLETFMRQKPDIMVIGEIRNKEVATSTVEAALTGHIVISTLHTNNVKASFTRLTSNLGITEDRIEDAFSGILSQRLVPKLCPHCRKKTSDGFEAGDGCDSCERTPGYSGLVLACEIAHMKKDIENYKVANFREYYSYADSAEDLRKAGLIDSKTYKMLKNL